MKVRFSKVFGISFIILGVVLLCLGLLTGGRGGFNITFMIGGFEILLGIMYLVKPYFLIDDHKLEVYALMGNVVSTYEFQSPREIVVENNAMFINQNGKRQKIKVSTWMADKSDWQKVLQKVNNKI